MSEAVERRPAPSAATAADPAVGHRALLVIPAYNEERSIATTLAELRRECSWAAVLVVNDGSRDETARIARSLGVRVLSLPFNLGIGGAVQTGFQYAVQHGYDVIVQVDADGQHVPGEVARLIGPVVHGTADVVVGSRFLEGRLYRQTPGRALGIAILARLIHLIVGRRFTDPTSGFRAYSRGAVLALAEEYPYDYPEPEALVYLSRRRFRILEIPVHMRPRRDGVSSIGFLVSVKYMFKVTLAIVLSAFRPARPGVGGGL